MSTGAAVLVYVGYLAFKMHLGSGQALWLASIPLRLRIKRVGLMDG